MENRVMCDNCYKEFIAKVHQLDYIAEGMIVIEGLICPHCNKEFVTNVTNNELREGMFKASELHQQIEELNEKKKRTYDSLLEDLERVPTVVCEQFARELEMLQTHYRIVCKANRELSEQLRSKYL